MPDVERRSVCADDDLDLDRGRRSVVARGENVLSSVATSKRPRSRSRSSSAQASAKLFRGSAATEKKHTIFADGQASKVDTRRAEDLSQAMPNLFDVREKDGPSTDHLHMDLTGGGNGIAPLAKESNRLDYIEASGAVPEECLNQLRSLSQTAIDLGLRQQQKMLATKRLQEKLVKSERTYGELLRESLELQRSIEDRRKQIKIDKQELEKEQDAVRTTGDELCTALATIHRLSHDIPSSAINGSKKHMTS